MEKIYFALIVVGEGPNKGKFLAHYFYEVGRKHPCLKFPGIASVESDRGERDVLRRALFEKTGLELQGIPVLVHKIPAGSGYDPAPKKLFYRITQSEVSGVPYTTNRVSEQGEEIGPPQWFTDKELLRDAKHGGLIYTHKPALVKFINPKGKKRWKTK